MLVTFISYDYNYRTGSAGIDVKDYLISVDIDLDLLSVAISDLILGRYYVYSPTTKSILTYDELDLYSGYVSSIFRNKVKNYLDLSSYPKINKLESGDYAFFSSSSVFLPITITKTNGGDPYYYRNNVHFNFSELEDFLLYKNTIFKKYERIFSYSVAGLSNFYVQVFLVVTFHYDSFLGCCFIMIYFPNDVTFNFNNDSVRFFCNYSVSRFNLKKIPTMCCLKSCFEPDKYLNLSKIFTQYLY